MKKIITVIILTAVLILPILSCSDKRNNKEFLATVYEISNGTAIVVPLENEEELKSSDKFSVPIGKFLQDCKVGDTVKITYSGDILEIYPAIPDGISDITLVK